MILLIKVIAMIILIMGSTVMSSVQLWIEYQYAASVVCVVLGMVISISYIVRYINHLIEDNTVHIDPNAACSGCTYGGIKGAVLSDGRQGCEVTCDEGCDTATNGKDCATYNKWTVYTTNDRSTV